MYRRVLPWRPAISRRKHSFLPPFVIGLAVWIGLPTQSAYQDMASLVSGIEGPSARWGSFVEKAVAGSVHSAEMNFVDAGLTTGTVSGAGIAAAGIGAVAFKGKNVAGDTPDEARVMRAGKRGRVVKIAPVGPPKSFSAGSVFERSSSLLEPLQDHSAMAFAKPAIKGQEVQIAAAFHGKTDRKTSRVPALLASLVNNEKADVLATAYAPPAPDYALASPFDSLLKEKEASGRFVPPMGDGDHLWMKKPLPAHVFSPKEQKCLATGIYFEARGEDARGQAAVAQVILNRVRNPTYPNSICGVVYQNDHMRNRCQFSFACDGVKDRVTSQKHWKVAEEVALAVTAGKIWLPEVGSSTHYHATYVAPRWARTMEKMKKIGLHVFYRTYGGGWS